MFFLLRSNPIAGQGFPLFFRIVPSPDFGELQEYHKFSAPFFLLNRAYFLWRLSGQYRLPVELAQ
jgi:hypothetical protein